MSQIYTNVTSTPSVATSYVENVGTAIPSGNILNVLGGVGITTSGAGNTITINSSGAGYSWNDVTGATQTLVAQNGYVTDRGAGVTYTLPASSTFGDAIAIVGKLGQWTIHQNANQQILVGIASSTIGAGGSIASTSASDCIDMICITGGAAAVWRVRDPQGNITVI